MTARRSPGQGLVAAERKLLYSPVWLVPYDDHRRRPLAAGFTVHLDRWRGTSWTPTGIVAVRTPSGAIVYPGLGRRRDAAVAEPELYRVRVQSTGYRALYLADEQESFRADRIGKEFLAYPYDDEHPPQMPVQPEPMVLVPATAYRYLPGTRVVHGLVRRAGEPVDNALVEATGATVPENHPWRERTLSDATGAFRLALRWAGVPAGDGSDNEEFLLTAVQGPGNTGGIVVRLPGELDLDHVIEISE